MKMQHAFMPAPRGEHKRVIPRLLLFNGLTLTPRHAGRFFTRQSAA